MRINTIDETRNFNRVYLHVPFCREKCDYCAFHSLSSKYVDINLYDRYLNRIEEELNRYRNKLFNIKSLYIGGGTPSFLSSEYLSRLIELLNKNITFSPKSEKTIECNPDSLDSEKIEIILKNFNRVSLGVQTLSKKFREILGRRGSIDNLDSIVNGFVAKGMDNISIDLIYAIPGKTVIEWEAELSYILDKYPVKHFSAYALSYDSGSKLYERVNRVLIDEEEDISVAMWDKCGDIASKYSIFRYEISNYAFPGYQCEHNLEIWFGDSYLGLGPSASSFDGIDRWTEPNLFQWLNRIEPEYDIISYHQRVKEIFIMGLRTGYPWEINIIDENSVSLISALGTREISVHYDWFYKIYDALMELKNLNLISIIKDNNKIEVKSTTKGLLFWNYIGERLI